MTPEQRAEKLMTEGFGWQAGWASYGTTLQTIADAIREAVKAEREECAVIALADLEAGPGRVEVAQRFDGGSSEKTARRIAAAIRGRTESQGKWPTRFTEAEEEDGEITSEPQRCSVKNCTACARCGLVCVSPTEALHGIRGEIRTVLVCPVCYQLSLTNPRMFAGPTWRIEEEKS